MYHRTLPSTLLLSTLAITSSLSFASNDEVTAQKGREIAIEIDKRDRGFFDSSAAVEMVLINRSGDKTLRELTFKRLESQESADKSLIRFGFPADIKGTALLTHPKLNDSDDQWLYLPSLNRVKRISSRNKSGAFVGSEFSFEDMTDKVVDDFTYQYIDTKPCIDSNPSFDKNTLCDVIDRFPVDTQSGYTKQRVWVDQPHRRIVRIDFYDRKKTHLKTMMAKNFSLFADKYWRPLNVEMINLQTQRKTQLNYSNIEFQQGLSDNELSRRALKRGK
ncbi:hypothetical protein BTO08_22280 (plasmid) [Photobacterium angustum]|uniref:Uncharacterized protein TP-0789 domain-containing protein n=2 Tax=Photobacterium angustum TaxID=661 RepID=A0A2S7VAC5_PHOAN|nr:hypothetical protein BTO08_22280 [Photobacterium angustum]